MDEYKGKPLTIETINNLMKVMAEENTGRPDLMPVHCPRCRRLIIWCILHGSPKVPPTQNHKKDCDLWEIMSGGLFDNALARSKDPNHKTLKDRDNR